jgi:hypothetical protein
MIRCPYALDTATSHLFRRSLRGVLLFPEHPTGPSLLSKSRSDLPLHLPGKITAFRMHRFGFRRRFDKPNIYSPFGPDTTGAIYTRLKKPHELPPGVSAIIVVL